MAVRRVVPNLPCKAPQAGADFYTGVLGLEAAMDLGFVVTYVSPDNRTAQISLMHGDPSGLQPAYSVEVDDADAAFARALDQGHEIAYPLTDEPWGVRRFFVRDPTGAIANVVSHRTGQDER